MKQKALVYTAQVHVNRRVELAKTFPCEDAALWCHVISSDEKRVDLDGKF